VNNDKENEMMLNPKNPEVDAALADADAGTLESRRLLISESVSMRDSVVEIDRYRHEIYDDATCRLAALDRVAQWYGSRYDTRSGTILQWIADADVVAQYVVTGVVPPPEATS
jgi:hypothetical protein